MNYEKMIESLYEGLKGAEERYKDCQPVDRRWGADYFQVAMCELRDGLDELSKLDDQEVIDCCSFIDFRRWCNPETWDFVKFLWIKDTYKLVSNCKRMDYALEPYTQPGDSALSDEEIPHFKEMCHRLFLHPGYSRQTGVALKVNLEHILTSLNALYKRTHRLHGQEAEDFCNGKVEEYHSDFVVDMMASSLESMSYKKMEARRTQLMLDLLNSRFLEKMECPTVGAIQNCKLRIDPLHLTPGTEITDRMKINLARLAHFAEQDQMGFISLNKEKLGRYLCFEHDIKDVGKFANFVRLLDMIQNKMKELQQDAQDLYFNKVAANKNAIVDDFFMKINMLVEYVMKDYNGKLCNLGGKNGQDTIHINIEGIEKQIEEDRKMRADEICLKCSPAAKTFNDFYCEYVGGLHDAGLFGVIPCKFLSDEMSKIIPLSSSSIQKKLIKKR